MEKIGIISDTHGVLRQDALKALQDVDMIIHAGDSGGPAILEKLSDIAPLHAVRGNCDYGEWACALSDDLVVQTSGGLFYALHDLYRLGIDPVAAAITAVIYGHTHMPSILYRDNVLYLNPGSAGPVRSGKPVTLALMEIEDRGAIHPEIIRL